MKDIKDTVNFDHIKAHYYGSHKRLILMVLFQQVQ